METPTVSASERMRTRWGMDTDETLVRPTKRDVGATGKQDAVNAVAAAAGIAAPTLKPSSGYSVPKALFVGVVQALDLPIDTGQAIVRIAEEIVYLADVPWDALCDSTAVGSRNTSSVTVRGLIKLRDAIVAMHRETSHLGVDNRVAIG